MARTVSRGELVRGGSLAELMGREIRAWIYQWENVFYAFRFDG